MVERVENHFAVASSLLPKYACYFGNLPEASCLVDILRAATGISSVEAGNFSIETVHSGVVVVDLSVASTSGYLSLD